MPNNKSSSGNISKVSWTNEQLEAIASRNSNLLVAAAAGSGKTAVLVERIIQMIIKDRIDINNLLVVTFTNAAAGEMKERLSEAILKELEKKNENEEHLRKQLNLLNQASISTLHTFCIDIVRNYFYFIDIDPNFRIADETEIGLLKLELLEDLLEDEYKKQEPLFLGLVESFGGNKDDKSLQNLILNLYDFIQSNPKPLLWLEQMVEQFAIDYDQFGKTEWYESLVEQITIDLLGAKGFIKEAVEICQMPDGPINYIDSLQSDFELLDNLLSLIKSNDLNNFYHKLDTDFKSLARIKKGEADPELQETVKKLRDQSKEIIRNIKTQILVKHPEELIADLNEMYPYMNYLYYLISSFSQIFRKRKIDKGIVDFNDLEHYALDILEQQQVREAYKHKFEYVFVDEYQDSNLVQETILSHIKRENNLFMVGDVKQSIYRFRLADPSLFIRKYQTYGTEASSQHRRIDLNKNFRSRKEIIDGINFIFKQIMTTELGEISYDEKAYLYQGAEVEPIKEAEIEVNLVEKEIEEDTVEIAVDEQEAEENAENELDALEDIEIEARITAKRIKELLQTEIYDHKQKAYRTVEYKDIVILLRSTKNWAEVFLDTLVHQSIPTFADVNSGFFTSIEINLFMNLLKVIDNKRQDIPLISLMRSPIGGFNIEELLEIRAETEANSFFEATEQYIIGGHEPLKEKLTQFMNKITIWQEESRYIPLDKFVWKLLSETGYYIYAGAMPGGIQRQANLQMLVDRAAQFQKGSIKGLFNFIKFIERLEKTSGDMGTAKTLGENDNVVRIMSIHKSKGLEFPIVFVAGMGKQFNLSDMRKQVLFHKSLGIGPKYVNLDFRQFYDSLAKTIMKYRIKVENLSEEMRILYVALTRAKDKLILVGSIRKITKTAEKWKKEVTPFYLLKGKSYYDWILPVLVRHKNNEMLRSIGDIHLDEQQLSADDSKWLFRKWTRKELAIADQDEHPAYHDLKQLLNDNEAYHNQGDSDFIEDRLSWRYDKSSSITIPSKLTVTDIKKLSTKDLAYVGVNIPALIKKPKFLETEKQFTAAEKGTIIHFVMQHFNISETATVEQINEQIETMVKNELLTNEQAKVVEPLKIVRFFDSDIGKRIAKADEIHREVPFNYLKKANSVIQGVDDLDDNLLIQGVIDLYFAENDEFVVVDYKTDYVEEETIEEIVTRYRVQIALYQEALEHITGKKVKESYLYLFQLDTQIKLF